MATGKVYQIVEGPSKFDLMIALFERSRGNWKLDFTIEALPDKLIRLPLVITTISYSGRSFSYAPSVVGWMIEGVVQGSMYSQSSNFTALWENEQHAPYYKAHYNSRNRRGHLAFSDKLLMPLTPQFLFAG
ncbi:hypothetical protein HYS85_00205 [Candidatus Saccharibacteria bacterium]|nr:hypothetical protein [Candidatus Saccharibacteria bacterium]